MRKIINKIRRRSRNIQHRATAVFPSSLPVLLAPPRSGTTLIANAIMAHPEVTGITEPYHRRRNANHSETPIAKLIQDYHLDLAAAPNVVIKETTTRPDKIRFSLELMRRAKDQGIYTGLVIILRCPFSAYPKSHRQSRLRCRNPRSASFRILSHGKCWANYQIAVMNSLIAR